MTGAAFDPTREPQNDVDPRDYDLGRELTNLSRQRENELDIHRNELGVRSQVLYNELYVAEQNNALVKGVMRYLRTFNPAGEVELAKPVSTPEAGIAVPDGLGALVLTKDGFRIKVEPKGYTVFEDLGTQAFNLLGSTAKKLVPSLKFEESTGIHRAVSVGDLNYFPIEFSAVTAPIVTYADAIVHKKAE